LFAFSTKAETLERLRSFITTAKILPQFSFTVQDFETNKEKLIEKIIALFPNQLIVVRSSALNEDSKENSMAGKYKSTLDVSTSNNFEIEKAIQETIKSYNNFNEKNQVLIQPQLKNILLSGVMFTKDIDTHAPYMIINYDDYTGKTDSVTSGKGTNLKVFTYYKYHNVLPSNENLSKLILCAKELERITGNNALDIEFGITSTGIYLLQVRPIASRPTVPPHFEEQFHHHLEEIKQFIINNNIRYPNLYGYRTIYGIMPDWNPAEIIGISPKPLAFSLYRILITDEMWPLSRQLIGYKDVGYQPGIYSFAGKPYVDVRMSLNTFLPSQISPLTSEKLINHYIDKLITNPEYHDKIEFEIALTCYSFDFDEKAKELKIKNFTDLEIKEIKQGLLNLTNQIICKHYFEIAQELSLTHSLDEKREKILKSDVSVEIKLAQLIHDCKYLGTLPFSKLARFAFISNTLLKSLLQKNIITYADYNGFFSSIKTITSEFLTDLSKLKNKELPRHAFLTKYGHLRPGTYDISSKSYGENFDEYIDVSKISFIEKNEESNELSVEKRARIQEEINKTGLNFTVDHFLQFAKESIRAREEAKFHFTKNIDAILKLCEQYVNSLGLVREDAAYLDIHDLLRYAYSSKPLQFVQHLREIITKNKQQYCITKSIRLPPLIYMEKNIDYFHLMDDKPNFITQKTITGDILCVDIENFEKDQLDGKIVLIENADPGYDWIFSHNIKGLITRYGGVASHMSIRAAELNLPAAIGCGGALYELCKNSQKIELDCAASQIRRII